MSSEDEWEEPPYPDKTTLEAFADAMLFSLGFLLCLGIGKLLVWIASLYATV